MTYLQDKVNTVGESVRGKQRFSSLQSTVGFANYRWLYNVLLAHNLSFPM
jgi:hypothetical protein